VLSQRSPDLIDVAPDAPFQTDGKARSLPGGVHRIENVSDIIFVEPIVKFMFFNIPGIKFLEHRNDEVRQQFQR
jgi:hypothetical protein